jgi:hypothetical protein
MALRAHRAPKWLPAMRLDQGRVLRVMAADAELRSGFNQVVIEFLCAVFSDFVRDVAGITAHVERSVTAAARGIAQSRFVTSEAEIFVLPARRLLPQQSLILGGVRVVTLEAILLSGRMNHDARLHSVLIPVTFKTEICDACSFQVYARGITHGADHVAGQTSHINRRMYVLAFAFFFVTLETLRSVGSFFQGDWMHDCERAGDHAREEQEGRYGCDSVDDFNRVLE